MVAEVNEEIFDGEVVKSTIPVLVDFSADWCGPCKMMAPIIEKMSTKYTGKIKVVKIDTDRNRNLAVKFTIQGIPSMLIFIEGKEVDRKVGYIGENELEAFITSHIS